MQDKLNSTQAAELLGLKPATLKAWRYRGKGPVYYKVGNKVIYYLKDLKNFIKRGK